MNVSPGDRISYTNKYAEGINNAFPKSVRQRQEYKFLLMGNKMTVKKIINHKSYYSIIVFCGKEEIEYQTLFYDEDVFDVILAPLVN